MKLLFFFTQNPCRYLNGSVAKQSEGNSMDCQGIWRHLLNFFRKKYVAIAVSIAIATYFFLKNISIDGAKCLGNPCLLPSDCFATLPLSYLHGFCGKKNKKKTIKTFACCKPRTWIPCTQADASTIVLAGFPCLQLQKFLYQ